MDINDLMSCSQMLLKSVSKTLEKSQIQAKEKDKPVEDALEISQIEKPIQESPSESFVNCAADDMNEQEIITESPREAAHLPENVLKQWASELIVAVNSLHKAGIVCGDLNLDNLLLGPAGHLTLTYFHQNDRSQFQQLCRLNPKAMKCLYVAFDFPITKESDWYSVGVLIYELITRDRFFLYHPVGVSRFNEVQYQNPDVLSDDVKDLLHGLIIEGAENRFKFNDLINHRFFKGVDFDEVEKCGLELFKV
jgi:ribosomal protein S6 kinase-like